MSEPREGRWSRKPLPDRRLRYLIWLMLPCSSVIVRLIVLAFNPNLRHALAWMEMAETCGMLAVFALALYHEIRIRRFSFQDAWRSESPEGLEEYPAEIAVRVGDAETGADRGILYFQNHLLGFVGERTSFLLAATDFGRPSGQVLTTIDGVWRPLPLRTARNASIVFRPLIGSERTFRKRMRAFLDAGESSTEERQWPPLAAYDEAPGFDVRRGERLSEPREGRWFAPPRALKDVHDRRSLDRYLRIAYGGIALFPIYLVTEHLGPRFGVFLSWILGGEVVACAALMAFVYRQRMLRKWSLRDQTFLDRESDVGEHPVEVVIYVGRKPIGADRGVVVFSEGLLAFHGKATSFCLIKADFVFDPGAQGFAPYPHRPKGGLRLRIQDRNACLRLIPLGKAQESFVPSFRSFLREKNVSNEPRQWPPLEAYSPPPTPSSSSDASAQTAGWGSREDEKGACLRDRLEDAVPLEHDVDQGALRVGELDQR